MIAPKTLGRNAHIPTEEAAIVEEWLLSLFLSFSFPHTQTYSPQELFVIASDSWYIYVGSIVCGKVAALLIPSFTRFVPVLLIPVFHKDFLFSLKLFGFFFASFKLKFIEVPSEQWVKKDFSCGTVKLGNCGWQTIKIFSTDLLGGEKGVF